MDKKLIATLLGILGYESMESQDGKVTLSEADWKKIQDAYKEKFGSKLELEGIEADEQGDFVFLESEILQVEELLKADAPTKSGNQSDKDWKAEYKKLQEEQKKTQNEVKKLTNQFAEMENKNKDAQEKIIKLSRSPEPDLEGIETGANKSKLVHSKSHFMASNNSWDAFEDRPWNQLAAGRIKMEEYTGIDIDKINEDFGKYYRQHREEFVSYLRGVSRLPSWWRTISNVTDELVYGQMLSGEITQARKKKWLPKGNFEFQPLKAKVYPIQIDVEMLGSELQALERSWMNFVNKEGSQAYKMSFVAFLAREILKKAAEEDEIGLIKGVYWPTSDDATVGAPAKYKMRGLRKLINEAIENRMLVPSSIGTPTASNILDYVKSLVRSIPEYWRDMPNMKLYMSNAWKLAYIEKRRLTLGLMPSYEETLTVDDHDNIEIVDLPYLDGSNRMFITTMDNISIMENVPKENTLLNMEKLKRDIYIFGDYKKGIHVDAFGKKWADGETMTKDYQMFFCNDVEDLVDTYIPIAANDTTPSVKSTAGVETTRHLSLKTGVNTEATQITDIEDVEIGEYVYIKGNTGSNQSTIADAGKFDLSAAITLTENTIILLYKRGADDFVEIQRWDTSAVPYVTLAADATKPDAADGNYFITVANSGATAITDIDNAVDGEIYKIGGGSDTNATTIAASGKFDRISDAITLEDGNWIKVRYVAADDNFVELDRYVAA